MLLQSLDENTIHRLLSRAENATELNCLASQKYIKNYKSGGMKFEITRTRGITFEPSVEHKNMVKRAMIGGNWFLQVPYHQRQHTILEVAR